MMYIFGAQSIALGTCKSIEMLQPDSGVDGFLVTRKEGNPDTLAGRRVWELGEIVTKVGEEERKHTKILIATPEDVQAEIEVALRGAGFFEIERIDSMATAKQMEEYYRRKGRVPLLADLGRAEDKNNGQSKKLKTEIFAASFHGDKPLHTSFIRPAWMHTLQAGAALTDHRTCDFADDTGDNISVKNADYCELTALYWIWKNRALPVLKRESTVGVSHRHYFGLAHYRRHLLIDEEDLDHIASNGVDAVLPFPMLYEPDINVHHRRYIPDADWQCLLQALKEIHPEDAEVYDEILSGECMYNYSLLLAETRTFCDYCGWLFPVLFRAEELMKERQGGHRPRLPGYMGEELVSLYFMCRRDRLRLVHCGFRFLY